MKTFVVLSESPLRVRKITIILISLLVPELLRSKDFIQRPLKCKRDKTFLVLSESPLRVRKIIIISISLLVLELLRSKDLKNYQKMVQKCEVLNKINQNQ